MKKENSAKNVDVLLCWNENQTTYSYIYNVMTIHVILNKKKTMEELTSIKNNIRNTLKDNGIEHVTLEFETVDEECVMEGCC